MESWIRKRHSGWTFRSADILEKANDLFRNDSVI
jgi:hypothetical protein